MFIKSAPFCDNVAILIILPKSYCDRNILWLFWFSKKCWNLAIFCAFLKYSFLESINGKGEPHKSYSAMSPLQLLLNNYFLIHGTELLLLFIVIHWIIVIIISFCWFSNIVRIKEASKINGYKITRSWSRYINHGYNKKISFTNSHQ